MSPVVMGVTSTVVYMLPFLSLPLTAAARCYILTLIQVLISTVQQCTQCTVLCSHSHTGPHLPGGDSRGRVGHTHNIVIIIIIDFIL